MKIPESRYWGLPVVNGVRVSGPPPSEIEPPPPPPAEGFAPEAGFSVSAGPYVDGTNLTITGSGFGVKANAAPMYLWDSRTGDLSASPLSRRSILLNTGLPKSIDADTGLGGRSTMRASLKPALPAPGNITIADWRVNASVAFAFPNVSIDQTPARITIFNRTYRNWGGQQAFAKVQELRALGGYTSADVRDWNIKDSRFWAGPTGTNTSNMMYSYGQVNTDPGNPRLAWELGGGGTNYGVAPFLGMTPNIWRTDYAVYQPSSGVNVPDSFIKLMQNDAYGQVTGRVSRNDTYPDTFQRLASIQYQFIYTNEDWNDWWDIYYVDDSGHAVILTDGTWGAVGTKYEIAIPTAWSDTSVTVNLRNGEWPDLVGKQVHIILDDGTRLYAGRFI